MQIRQNREKYKNSSAFLLKKKNKTKEIFTIFEKLLNC